MRIDLHTHSSVSDGTDPPDRLVVAAKAAGLDVVALTDHDTVDGWVLAQRAADRCGITLVPGIELSTRLAGTSVHLLAYWPDPTLPALAEEMALVRTARSGRVRRILARLAEHGVHLDIADVEREAASASSVGRPHVADALVSAGLVADREEAFRDWLGQGRPGDVGKYEPATVDAIGLIADAGGISVLAHPWGRASRTVLDAATIGTLAEAGLTGLEVDHEDHEPEDRERLRRIAAELDLVTTGSSDHHGTGKPGHPLGCWTTTPEAYERLVAAGHAAAATAGRGGPGSVT